MNKTIYLIAEIGVNHNGSLKLAKKAIALAKKNGANAVKFQTFKAEHLVSPNTPKTEYQKKNIPNQQTHFNMIKSLELDEKQHIKIINYCKTLKIDFISTPYGINDAKLLNKIGCKIFKTASADIVDLEMHEYLSKINQKIIISTGMSSIKEIAACLNIYKKNKKKNILLLHCVSNYPCSYESLNIKSIELLKKKFSVDVGFSDHSVGNMASILSLAFGSSVIEKHFTISKLLKGPDQATSVTPKEFKMLSQDLKLATTILGKEEKKCQPEEKNMKMIARKSLTLKRFIHKNEKIGKKDLTLMRPGYGLYYKNINKIIGKRAKKNLTKFHQIKFSDLKS
jgi:N,N'-diacetyllegionaminate synthase